MRLNLFVTLKYQSNTKILSVGIKYTVRKILFDVNKCKKKLNSLTQFLTATRPTSHNKNGKNKKVAITLAARRHNVDMLLSNSTFLIFAVLVV